MSLSSAHTWVRSRRALFHAAAGLLIMAFLIPVYWTGGAPALSLAIPCAAVAVGVALFVISGPSYIEYLCWVWFLTPLLRRLLDYAQGAYTPTSPLMLSPILVSLICAIPFVRSLVRGRIPVTSPFVLALAAVGVGFAIGVVRNGAAAAAYDALLWSAPLFVGTYIAENFRIYPDFRRAVQRAFVMGGLVLGIYGVVQFIDPAPWDRLWMEGSGMMSIGRPEPFGVRVFGPLNAPGPYAIVLMVSLTLTLAGRGFAVAGPAAAGFLLSLVRAAWGGLAVGVLWFAGHLRGRERTRLLALVGVAVLLVLPFLRYQPIQERVDERAQSLTSLEEDGSMRARLAIYTTRGPQALMRAPLGWGLGAIGTAAKLSVGQSASFDSGLFAVPLALSIPGALLYAVGLGLLLRRFVLRRQAERFAQAAASVVVSILALLLFANQLAGLPGTLLWMCTGLVVSSNLYHADEGSVGHTAPRLRHRL